MDPLVRGALLLRGAFRRAHGMVLAVALGAFVVSGGAMTSFGVGQVAALVVWGLLLFSRLRVKLRVTGEAPFRVDVEIGALLAVGLDAALLRYEGGLDGSLSPAVYVLVAVVAAFARPLAGGVVVAWVVVLEAAIRRFTLGEDDGRTLAIHSAFVAAFAVLNLAFLRAEVARIRASARARVEEQIVRLKEDARSYRLLGAGEVHEEAESQDGGKGESSPHAAAESRADRLARSSVEEIHLSVHYALDLLRRTLDLHTAVLLWLNDAGTHLRISELATGSDDIRDAPFLAGDGVLGAVIARRERVSLHDLKPSYKVPYYDGPCPVRALTAIPVIDAAGQSAGDSASVLRAARAAPGEGGGTLRGVLAIDRVDNRPFTPHEEELAAQAARHCLRAIQNERVFIQLERAKVEQGKLYRAAQSLSAALSEKDVLDAAVKSAREIASFDFAAVTIFDESARMHEVVAAKGTDGEIDDLVGARFAPNAGLVSMVVLNRCALPYRGEFDAAHQIVLTRRFPWPKVPSLLVLPLILHDRALGTLILGAKRRQAFGEAVRPTLEVLASHLATSLSNARMIAQLEKMATTDGLTGLLNKRAMLDEAERKVAAAARFGRALSVLVVDIDLFKKVNDTYGHDVGDTVIRGVGDVLKRHKRNTDVVSRFGGEEFVALCEQTDAKGAMLLAERIREELAKIVFHAPNGTLSVTCSIGVATFPDAGQSWETLFKSADEALYVSKRSGRNRSTAWSARGALGNAAGARVKAAG
ncbi:MAG: diguanylate cyclase [Polyangiaceae bacterium]